MLSTTQRNLALFALALGGFGIGTTEFVSMGLLPQIAEKLIPTFQADPHAGIAHAGWMITAYALGVVVGAPTLAVLTARMSQRTLVLILDRQSTRLNSSHVAISYAVFCLTQE